jgi:hypothetical protein
MPIRLTSLLIVGLTGAFFCFALRELRVGNIETFWQRAPNMMLFSWCVFGIAFWRIVRSQICRIGSPERFFVRRADSAYSDPACG